MGGAAPPPAAGGGPGLLLLVLALLRPAATAALYLAPLPGPNASEPRKYVRPVEVALVSKLEGATVHYTLDGTEPTGASPAYTAPFALGLGVQVVKAVQVGADGKPGEVKEGWYEVQKMVRGSVLNGYSILRSCEVVVDPAWAWEVPGERLGAYTDAEGHFSFLSSAEGYLVMKPTGEQCVKVATNLAAKLPQVAPDVSSVVTPLTTLAAGLMAHSGLTAAEGKACALRAFGLGSYDLYGEDPKAGAGAEGRAAALGAMAAVETFFVAGTESWSFWKAHANRTAAWASLTQHLLAAVSKDTCEPRDRLADRAFVQELLASCMGLADANATVVAASVGPMASYIATMNGLIGERVAESRRTGADPLFFVTTLAKLAQGGFLEELQLLLNAGNGTALAGFTAGLRAAAEEVLDGVPPPPPAAVPPGDDGGGGGGGRFNTTEIYEEVRGKLSVTVVATLLVLGFGLVTLCYFWRRCRKGWATQATQQQKVETSLALSDLSDSIRIMEGQQALSPQKPPLKQAQLSPKKGKRERKPPGRKGSRYSALEEP